MGLLSKQKPDLRRAGLIALLVVVLLAFISVAVVAVRARSFWRDLDAYTDAAETAISIQYLDRSNEPKAGNVVSIRRTPPRFLGAWFGEYLLGAFAEVERISLRNAESAALSAAARFRSLELLQVAEVPVTKGALVELSRSCKLLKSVAFTSTGIDDDSLCMLARLPKLESISLMNEPNVREEGICCFAEQASLQHVTVWGNAGLQDAARCLRQLSLKTITLAGPQFGDADVAALSESGTLLRLKLIGTGITDESIESIRRNPNLEELWISESPMTLDALQGLGSLRRLRMVVLRNTNVPPEEVERLRTLIPNARILVGASP